MQHKFEIGPSENAYAFTTERIVVGHHNESLPITDPTDQYFWSAKSRRFVGGVGFL